LPRQTRPKGRGTSNLAMYKLIELLHREAKIVHVSLSLLCDGKVQRTTSKSHRHIQSQLSALWDDYDSGIKHVDWIGLKEHIPSHMDIKRRVHAQGDR